MKRMFKACSAGLAVTLLAASADAQPKMIVVSGAEDIDSTGSKTVGRCSGCSDTNANT